MKKNIKNIRRHWNERAQNLKANPRATTADYTLRAIEERRLEHTLRQITHKRNILDIGCGDGFVTIKLAAQFPKSRFVGGDYAGSMIASARTFLQKSRPQPKNIAFQILDVLHLGDCTRKFNVVISDRCLINLPSRKLQMKAVGEIANALQRGGHYVMIENFIEGHNHMNRLRRKLNLKAIPVRWHNTYLNQDFIQKVVGKRFSLVKQENISSLYYLITRVVYSKICQLEGREPDYDHVIYQIAAQIDEPLGDYGPVTLLVFQKK